MTSYEVRRAACEVRRAACEDMILRATSVLEMLDRVVHPQNRQQARWALKHAANGQMTDGYYQDLLSFEGLFRGTKAQMPYAQFLNAANAYRRRRNVAEFGVPDEPTPGHPRPLSMPSDSAVANAMAVAKDKPIPAAIREALDKAIAEDPLMHGRVVHDVSLPKKHKPKKAKPMATKKKINTSIAVDAAKEGLKLATVAAGGDILLNLAKNIEVPIIQEALKTEHGRELVKFVLASLICGAANTGIPHIGKAADVAALQVTLSTMNLTGHYMKLLTGSVAALAALGAGEEQPSIDFATDANKAYA